jgi:hypothetical protein
VENDSLEELYISSMSDISTHLAKGYNVLEISAVLVRLGLELYKTSLDEEGFHKIIDFISDNRDSIKPLLGEIKNVH